MLDLLMLSYIMTSQCLLSKNLGRGGPRLLVSVVRLNLAGPSGRPRILAKTQGGFITFPVCTWLYMGTFPYLFVLCIYCLCFSLFLHALTLPILPSCARSGFSDTAWDTMGAHSHLSDSMTGLPMGMPLTQVPTEILSGSSRISSHPDSQIWR